MVQILSSVFSAWPINKVQATEPHVYLSEIAWAGSSLSTSDEWIELTNPIDDEIAIGGWKITGAGASGKALILPNDAVIPAGGAYLIANYASDDPHCSLDIQPNVVTTTISLSNSAIDIQLFDTNGQLVDRAGDGHAPPAGYSEAIKATIVRLDFLISGDLAEAWETADSSQNLKTADLGTPGLIDIPIINPDPPTEISPSPTNTEPIVYEPETSTITDDVMTSVTTTEIEVTLPDLSVSSTEATTTTVLSIENTTSTQSDQSLETTATIDPSNVQFLRLNEIMPNPAEGPEWVEITNAMPDRNISLEGLELHDAVGKFMTLKGSVTSGHLFVVFDLTSARLNNSGDSLYLKKPDGSVIDTLTYASSQEGVTWARDAQGAWRETVAPTPGSENSISEKSIQIPETSKYEPVTIKATKKASTTKATIPKTKASEKTVTTTASIAPKKQSPTKVQAATEKKTATTTKSAAKKTTTTKSTSTVKAPISIEFDMLNDDTYGGLRVRLTGQVGSSARLLTGRSFILLNPEGRGLLVKVPSGNKMPNMNSFLEVTGTLKFDTHDFPYLSLTKNDWLKELKASTSSSSREVTWWAPATEDAWSLVSATGTVQAVSGSTVNLLVDDAEVDLKIKSGVNYRASRLKKGDLINVTGLLDMTSQRPAILPRNADEIILIKYASSSIQQASEPPKPSGLPGWTPFGAALGAIGAVEGVKKLRNRKKTVKT